MASHAHNRQPAQQQHHRRRRQHRHPHQRHDNMHHPHHSQLRLKCIVLGSAGAGKTSLLRRFIHETFERDRQGTNDGESSSSWRNRTRTGENANSNRSTTSTLGADYYVKKVDNPLFINEHPNGGEDDARYFDEKKNSSPSSDGNDNVVKTEPHVLVQLWDTAGRERLKAQRHTAKRNFYQFLSIRPSSSSNACHYEHRYNNWGSDNGVAEKDCRLKSQTDNSRGQRSEYLCKRWNANQRRGRPLKDYPHDVRHARPNANKPMEDALFRNIDACMLVYDATSCMSFLHLMKWHSEWVQKLNRWEREEAEKDVSIINRKTRSSSRRKRIPFIVVANKIDLLDGEREKSCQVRLSGGQKGRSVMGFRGGEYKGQDLKYEYAAENTASTQCSRGDRHHQPNCHLQCNSGSATTRAAGRGPPPIKRLTYSLKETSWYDDATYLNALQLAEDQLRANRLMILLWCQRNSIPHVEASALDGRGVDEAMGHLIKIGVEELESRESEESERLHSQEPSDVESKTNSTIRPEEAAGEEGFAPWESDISEDTVADFPADTSNDIGLDRNDRAGGEVENVAPAVATTDPSQYYFLYQPRQDEKLDLFARYSPKDEQRCSPFKCWLPLFSYCHQ